MKLIDETVQVSLAGATIWNASLFVKRILEEKHETSVLSVHH